MKIIASALWLALSASATAAPAADAPTAPGGPQAQAALTAEIGPVFGSAQFQSGGSDTWFFAKAGRRLSAGGVVKTEAGSYCLIFFSDGTKLRLAPKTELRMQEASADTTSLSLGSGRIEAWVKDRKGSAFKTSAPMFAAALAEGTFSAEILSLTSATLDVFAGEASVQDSLGKTARVSSGQRVELGVTAGASTPAPLPAGAVKPEEPMREGPARPAQVTPSQAVPPAAAPQAAPAPAAKKPVKKISAATGAVIEPTDTPKPAPAEVKPVETPAPKANPTAPAKPGNPDIDSQL